MLGQNLDESEICEQLQVDASDRGYEHLSDAEILAEVTSLQTQDSDEDETDTVSEQGADSCSSSVSISLGEALKMFNGCIAWLQQQDEASLHSLSVLHDMRRWQQRSD